MSARTASSALSAVLSLATLAAVGAAWWDLSARVATAGTATARIDEQSKHIDRLEAAIQALRIEGKSASKGVDGVLEQIHQWAEVLGSVRYTDAHYSQAEASMQDALRAMSAHGDAAFQAIYDDIAAAAKIESTEINVDERRKWLLRAAIQADPKRGTELVVRYLRGHDADLNPSPRMRWIAADELIELDPVLAAAELRTILTTESARGIDPASVRGEIPASRSMAGFNNFVGRYDRAETDDVAKAQTLIQVIGKPEHDMATQQECVKILGMLGAQDAVPFIKRLYTNPTEIANNAIFKNHCINALVSIQGTAACAWLQEQYTTEKNERVLSSLLAKIKELGC